MKKGPYVPLLAKVLGWLVLHLVILALAFGGFLRWQLGLGLESLLSGAAGGRLREFGELARDRISGQPPSGWNEAVRPLAEAKGLFAAFYQPGPSVRYPRPVPRNVESRLNEVVPPRPGPRDRRGGDEMGPGVGREPPRSGPREWRGPPPDEDMDRFGGPPDFPPGLKPQPMDNRRPPDQQPGVRPLFLLKGDSGDGYWAAIQIVWAVESGGPPRMATLLIRADQMDGSGMFFEIRPWLLGGLAVLAASLAIWTPFVWSFTRYINRLTAATGRIAAGQFEISLPGRGNDELGNLGRSIETMAARLEHLIAGQKRFLGDAAHELCAPLARLRTGLAILEAKLDGAAGSQLEQIEEDALELASLIEEVLAFSRAGSRATVLQEMDLETVIHGVLLRDGGDLDVDLQLPTGLAAVADLGLLARALGNLIRNVRVHAGEDAKVSIRARKVGDRIELRVTDNGPGVPASELPKLFEPFYRPDRSRSRETGGFGLGLAIVRGAVESCGGDIQASIADSGGLCVTLILPASASNATACADLDH